MASGSANSGTKRTTRKSVTRGFSKRVKPNRAQKVWMSLVASMTVVGGVLLALDRSPAPGAGGLALPPLMSVSGPDSLETVLNTRAPLDKSRWTSIVIHSSGSPVGSPASLDEQARANGLKGVGYDFIIGNGAGLSDGQIHVTNRWMQQTNGAHAAGPKADDFNRHGIGICLIGDGDRQAFSRAQMERLIRLVDLLCKELDIPAERVYLHSDVAQVSSPGRLFPASSLRTQLASRR